MTIIMMGKLTDYKDLDKHTVIPLIYWQHTHYRTRFWSNIWSWHSSHEENVRKPHLLLCFYPNILVRPHDELSLQANDITSPSYKRNLLTDSPVHEITRRTRQKSKREKYLKKPTDTMWPVKVMCVYTEAMAQQHLVGASEGLLRQLIYIRNGPTESRKGFVSQDCQFNYE